MAPDHKLRPTHISTSIPSHILDKERHENYMPSTPWANPTHNPCSWENISDTSIYSIFWPPFCLGCLCAQSGPRTHTQIYNTVLCAYAADPQSHPMWLRLEFHFTSSLLLIFASPWITSYTPCIHTTTQTGTKTHILASPFVLLLLFFTSSLSSQPIHSFLSFLLKREREREHMSITYEMNKGNIS